MSDHARPLLSVIAFFGMMMFCYVFVTLAFISGSLPATRRRLICVCVCFAVAATAAIFTSSPLLYLVAFLLSVLTVVLYVSDPGPRHTVAEVGRNMGGPVKSSDALERLQKARQHPPLLTIGSEVIEERMLHDSPPEGLWTMIYNNPMTAGRVYEVQCRFSPPRTWPAEAFRGNPGNPTLRLDVIGPTFFIKPEHREVLLRDMSNFVRTEVLVTPQKRGKMPLRIEAFVGATPIGWRQETVTVHSSASGFLMTATAIVGAIASVFSVLKALRIL